MQRIVILGGGFGGIRAALELNKKLHSRKDVQIMLVDRNNAQTFQPSLYEVASAYGISRTDPFYRQLKATVAIPYAEIFRSTRIQTIQAEISGGDLTTKTIQTSGGETLDFDYLILALGSEVSTYNIEGVGEYAYKFKTLDDALKLFEDIEQAYLTAERHQKSLPLRFLIGGAGFNGIELACELSRCAEHVAHKHKLDLKQCSDITLIEAMPQILPMVSDRERGITKMRLGKLGVQVLENAAIEKVLNGKQLQLKTGAILDADFVIWTAGVKAPENLKLINGLQLDQSERIIVNDAMQCQNYTNIFAVGDSTTLIDSKTNKPVPQMAFVAIQQARTAAVNITKLVHKNSALRRYRPDYDFWVAPMGGKYALAHLGRLHFAGKLGYLIRELVDLRYFTSILPFSRVLVLVWRRLSVFLRND